MANKRISDLSQTQQLVGTEETIVDQVADTISGFDTRKTTLSSIQEFTLSGAPFLTVTGETNFNNNVFINNPDIGTSILSSCGDACFRSLSAIGTFTDPDGGGIYASNRIIVGDSAAECGYVRSFDLCSSGGAILSSCDGGITSTDLSDLFAAGGGTLVSITENGNCTDQGICLLGGDLKGFTCGSDPVNIVTSGGLSANSITVNFSGDNGARPNVIDAAAVNCSSSILGGEDNKICSAPFSVIASGSGNNLCGSGNSFIGAGCGNFAGSRATVIAGFSSRAEGLNSFIGAGSANQTFGNEAFIGGGSCNTAFSGSVVLAGCYNTAKFDGTVVGGFCNVATGQHTVVVGGRFNQSLGDRNTIGGGCRNKAENGCAIFIGGGRGHQAGRINCADPNQTGGARSTFSVIVGGQYNALSGGTTFIGGGCMNNVAGFGNTIVNGHCNVAGYHGFEITGSSALCNFMTCGAANPPRRVDGALMTGGFQGHNFIGAGCRNTALSGYSVVVGGQCNVANGARSFVGGGCCNRMEKAKASVIVGGEKNTIRQNLVNQGTEYSFIGGGLSNCITDKCNSIVGGICNLIRGNLGENGFIGGGFGNQITQRYVTIGGGRTNSGYGACSTIAGGFSSRSSGSFSSIAGGCGNSTLSIASTVGGGRNNKIHSGNDSTIVGGINNFIDGKSCVVVAGANIEIGSGHDICTTYVNNLSTNGIVKAKTLSATGAFTGSGTFTTFTIQGGIITAAS